LQQLDLGFTRIDGSVKHFLKLGSFCLHLPYFNYHVASADAFCCCCCRCCCCIPCNRRFSKAGFVSIEDHAKWKYLLSADGCVAQTRLVKVMLANSVVIKEESDWIEYYYRCGSRHEMNG
jgi:hypothetical protein